MSSVFLSKRDLKSAQVATAVTLARCSEEVLKRGASARGEQMQARVDVGLKAYHDTLLANGVTTYTVWARPGRLRCLSVP